VLVEVAQLAAERAIRGGHAEVWICGKRDGVVHVDSDRVRKDATRFDNFITERHAAIGLEQQDDALGLEETWLVLCAFFVLKFPRAAERVTVEDLDRVVEICFYAALAAAHRA